MVAIDVLVSAEQRVGHNDWWFKKGGFLEVGHLTWVSKKELDSTTGK